MHKSIAGRSLRSCSNGGTEPPTRRTGKGGSISLLAAISEQQTDFPSRTSTNSSTESNPSEQPNLESRRKNLPQRNQDPNSQDPTPANHPVQLGREISTQLGHGHGHGHSLPDHAFPLGPHAPSYLSPTPHPDPTQRSSDSVSSPPHTPQKTKSPSRFAWQDRVVSSWGGDSRGRKPPPFLAVGEEGAPAFPLVKGGARREDGRRREGAVVNWSRGPVSSLGIESGVGSGRGGKRGLGNERPPRTPVKKVSL